MLRRDLDPRTREIGGEDCLSLGHGFDRKETLPQLSAIAQTLRVPAEVLAELERRLARVALQAQSQPRVLERGREPLFGCRIGALGAAVEQVAGLGEEPRIPEGAARDHDACAARVP